MTSAAGSPPVIVFLTDFGLRDPYVGICHAVLARLAPHARVIDLSHGVPPQDVRAGALMLLDSLPYVPPGVVLAVVDPGVGTRRRAVAVATGQGGTRRWFVGPDNGLLAPAISAAAGARAVWSIERPAGGGQVSATFHGRDLFAPAAALLAGGGDPTTFGAPLPTESLTPMPFPAPAVGEGFLVAEILVVDRFGTFALSAGRPDLDAAGLRPGDALQVRLADGEEVLAARVARTFGDVSPGEALVLVDSAERVAVAVSGGRATDRLPARSGDTLRVERAREPR